MKDSQRRFNHSEFSSRNYFFIDDNLRSEIGTKTIFFAGCGLGGNIALLASRTGFKNMILMDDDKVEVSNLNRQIFNTEHVGENKAKVVSKLVRLVNPSINTTVMEGKVTEDRVEKLLRGVDFIINTIDVGRTFFKLCDVAQKKGKVVLIPMNIGYGSFLLVLKKETPFLSEIFDTDSVSSDLGLITTYLASNKQIKIPAYLKDNAGKMIAEIQKKEINPQIGIASNMTSALVITSIIRLIKNENVKLAPIPIWEDLYKN